MAPKIWISVIIPVLNEAGRIGNTLEALLAAEGAEGAEILVVDGHPKQTTIQGLSAGPVRGVSGPLGRGAQLHAGALESVGPVLLFLHADTRLEPDALQQIRRAMEAPEFSGGAFDLGIDARDAAFRWIERGASLRSRLTRVPYGDQALFLRRDVYFRLGGFRPIPLMEDVDLMRRLKRSGGKICIIRQRVWTSARRWRREGILFCTLRNYALLAAFHFGARPDRLARFYRRNGSGIGAQRGFQRPANPL